LEGNQGSDLQNQMQEKAECLLANMMDAVQ